MTHTVLSDEPGLCTCQKPPSAWESCSAEAEQVGASTYAHDTDVAWTSCPGSPYVHVCAGAPASGVILGVVAPTLAALAVTSTSGAELRTFCVPPPSAVLHAEASADPEQQHSRK